VAVLSGALVLSGAGLAVAPKKEQPAPKTIRLIVDYGDGVEKHFTAIAHKKEMTVLDALNAAKASPHGITFDSKGRGQYTLVTKIDDLKNAGGGQGQRNWLCWVNDKPLEKSIAITELKLDDVVRWKFALFDELTRKKK